MRRLIMAGCAVLALGLAGSAQATEKGAVGGAVAGAVGGAVVAGPVGAVVGGVGGAVVGNHVSNHHRYWRLVGGGERGPRPSNPLSSFASQHTHGGAGDDATSPARLILAYVEL